MQPVLPSPQRVCRFCQLLLCDRSRGVPVILLDLLLHVSRFDLAGHAFAPIIGCRWKKQAPKAARPPARRAATSSAAAEDTLSSGDDIAGAVGKRERSPAAPAAPVNPFKRQRPSEDQRNRAAGGLNEDRVKKPTSVQVRKHSLCR